MAEICGNGAALIMKAAAGSMALARGMANHRQIETSINRRLEVAKCQKMKRQENEQKANENPRSEYR